jgi:hypothetical protein
LQRAIHRAGSMAQMGACHIPMMSLYHQIGPDAVTTACSRPLIACGIPHPLVQPPRTMASGAGQADRALIEMPRLRAPAVAGPIWGFPDQG